MRAVLTVAVLAAGATICTAEAAPLTAGGLVVICTSSSQENIIGCEAYIDGFAEGMARGRAACAPPDAFREVRALYLALPAERIGSHLAAEVLGDLIAATYPCR